MYIRDETHPIKSVTGFTHETTGKRDLNLFMNRTQIEGVQREVIGNSHIDNRQIEAIYFGDLSGRVLAMISGVHGGQEWVAAYAALDFFRALHTPSLFYNQQPHLEMIMKNYDAVYYIPMVNPDGFVNNTRENGNDVDLNRNFGANTPQTENIAVQQALERVQPDVFIDVHDRGATGVGLAGVDSNRGNLDNHYIHTVYTAIRYTTELMGDEFAGYHGSGSASTGEARRWVLENLGVPSYLTEAGDGYTEDESFTQIRFRRNMNALFSVLLARHLHARRMNVYTK